MPAARKGLDLRQAIAVGVLAGLIVVAIVLTLDTLQRRRMWKEVDDALATGATPRAPDRKEQDERSSNGAVGGLHNGEPIPGVPGDGLDGADPPAPPSDS